jgi:hypothetical protein
MIYAVIVTIKQPAEVKHVVLEPTLERAIRQGGDLAEQMLKLMQPTEDAAVARACLQKYQNYFVDRTNLNGVELHWSVQICQCDDYIFTTEGS